MLGYVHLLPETRPALERRTVAGTALWVLEGDLDGGLLPRRRLRRWTRRLAECGVSHAALPPGREAEFAPIRPVLPDGLRLALLPRLLDCLAPAGDTALLLADRADSRTLCAARVLAERFRHLRLSVGPGQEALERQLLRQLGPGVEITARPCPLFVPLVEAGYVDHSETGKQQVTKLVIAQYLTEVREAGVDTLILGCTHYPLLKSMIGEFMGPGVTLVDPAMTAAHHLERMLAERGLRADHENGQAHFYVSDVPDSFVQTADLFLGEYKGGPVEQIAIDKY